MPSAVIPGNKMIKQVWSPGSLQGIYATAETIASRDLNNLYRTSCYFADPEKYRAFCALYAVMRIVDDRIDEVLARREVSDDERNREREILEAWRRIVTACLAGRSPDEQDICGTGQPQVDVLLATFSEAIELFPVPAVLWENFFTSMGWDLEEGRFKSYREFLEYTKGASVAPTTIYLYLIAAVRPDKGGAYHPPDEFDLIRCGRELGLFAYIGHILRDLPHDIAAGDRGLLYLTSEDMAAHGITEQVLFSDLDSGITSPPLKALIRELVERARASASRGRADMQVLEGKLDPDCVFILELIVRIYEKVIDKIVSCSCDVMADRHRLTDLEKIQIAVETADSMGLTLA